MARRKYLDLIVLLMVSVFVITVSAQVYYSLGMTSTVTTTVNDVYFVKGPDNGTAGVNIFNDNKSATLTMLRAYPNMTLSYDDPIRVRNNHTTADLKVRLRPVLRTGGAQYFVYINFTLNTTTPLSLNYTSNGVSWTDPTETAFVTCMHDTEYAIRVQTMANATATSGQTATIEIAVDVET